MCPVNDGHVLAHITAKVALTAAGRSTVASEACGEIPHENQCLYYQAPYAYLAAGWFGHSGKDCKAR